MTFYVKGNLTDDQLSSLQAMFEDRHRQQQPLIAAAQDQPTIDLQGKTYRRIPTMTCIASTASALIAAAP